MSETESKRGETEEAEGTGFRVIDRRRFAPDGSERDETAVAPQGAGPAAGEASPAAAPSAPRTQGDDFVMSSPAPGEPGEALPEPTLSTLLLSLSTQALMHLGEIPDLSSGKPERDLPAARGIIDLIAVLEKKTRGNLDAAESALFERILYDLRMRFVEISRS